MSDNELAFRRIGLIIFFATIVAHTLLFGTLTPLNEAKSHIFGLILLACTVPGLWLIFKQWRDSDVERDTITAIATGLFIGSIVVGLVFAFSP